VLHLGRFLSYSQALNYAEKAFKGQALRLLRSLVNYDDKKFIILGADLKKYCRERPSLAETCQRKYRLNKEEIRNSGKRHSGKILCTSFLSFLFCVFGARASVDLNQRVASSSREHWPKWKTLYVHIMNLQACKITRLAEEVNGSESFRFDGISWLELFVRFEIR
jgi:hypothetical protein